MTGPKHSGAVDPVELVRQCQEAADQAPEDGDLRAALGQAMLHAGDMAGADAAYAEALRLGTARTAEAWTQRAGVAAMQGDPETSERYLGQALEADDAHAPAWANLGFLHLQRGDAAQAVTALKRASELAPVPPVLARLGIAQLAAGDMEGSVRSSRKALELAPDFGPAHDTLAVAAYNQGDLDLAREHMHKARACGFEPSPGLAQALERDASQGKA